MPLLNTAAAIYAGASKADKVYLGSNLVWTAEVAGPFLDQLAVQPQAVWSLRKLISTAVLSLRIRRSSDNAELDIGFSAGNLDASTLLTFVGAGSGYVSTWYDQSGNNQHLINTVMSQQPRLVNAGVLQDSIAWDGVDDNLRSSIVSLDTPHFSMYAQIYALPYGGNRALLDTGMGGTVGQSVTLYIGSRWYTMGRNAPSVVGQLGFSPPVPGGFIKLSVIMDRTLPQATESKLRQDSVPMMVTNTFGVNLTGSFASASIVVGSMGDGTLPGNYKVSSLVVYNTATVDHADVIESII